MSRHFRRILFYFFVLIFFIVAPIIIAYSYGYKYDFERKKFVQTGAFSIKTQPKKAKILINGKSVSKFSPALIKRLLPHQYKISAKLDGFYSWDKNLEVYPGIVTKAEDIILFPSKPQSFLLNEDKMNNFFISPDKERILYIKKDGIWLQELEKNSAAIQVVKNESLGDSSSVGYNFQNIQWSQNSKYFVFHANKNWFFVDIQKPSAIMNLNNILGNEISDLKWSSKDSDTLFFLRNKELQKFEWRSRTSAQVIENVASYAIYNNAIYYIFDSNQFVYQTDLNGQNRQQISFHNEENIILNDIRVSNNNVIIVYDKNSNVYLVKNGLLKLLSSQIKKTEFSPDGKKLLIQTDHEIFVYFLDDIEGAPNRKKDEKILITRYNASIEKSSWIPLNYEYVIFEVDNTIKVAEIDDRDHLNTIDIARGRSFEVSFNNETFGPATLNIYYTDDKGLEVIKIEQ